MGDGERTLKSFLSGGVAGVVSKSIIAPIERVKYLFITCNRPFTYNHFYEDFRLIIRQHGISNLWRGNLLSVLRIFPHTGIDFAVFDYTRRRFYVPGASFSNVTLFLCGSVAGACSITITTPLQFLRVRLAMEKSNFSYHGTIDATQKILARQGFLGFYRGFISAIMGVLIYHGTSFFIFTRLKHEWQRRKQSHHWYVDVGLGALSAVGQLVAYPFDILRKRMQGQALLLQKGLITTIVGYRGLIYDIFTHEKGFLGFYKGVSLNCIKAPLASATSWTVKNAINRKLDHKYDL